MYRLSSSRTYPTPYSVAQVDRIIARCGGLFIHHAITSSDPQWPQAMISPTYVPSYPAASTLSRGLDPSEPVWLGESIPDMSWQCARGLGEGRVQREGRQAGGLSPLVDLRRDDLFDGEIVRREWRRRRNELLGDDGQIEGAGCVRPACRRRREHALERKEYC